MIIPSNPDLKDVKESSSIVNRATVPDYPPPAYFNSRSQAVAGPSERELPPIPAVPDTVKPINLLSVSRPNGSIKGTYVIDPDIKIPQSLLPPLAADETEATRRNAYFHAKNGSIKVDIFIVGDADSKHPADILIDSSNGSIKTKLHASDTARPAVRFKAHSANGSVTVHIPLSFRGPVTVRSWKSFGCSDALAANLTTFNEVNHMRRCFVGEFSDWIDYPEGWIGDEINIESSNGSVKLLYDAEPKAKDLKAASRPKYQAPSPRSGVLRRHRKE